jgi:hypothetical protein
MNFLSNLNPGNRSRKDTVPGGMMFVASGKTSIELAILPLWKSFRCVQLTWSGGKFCFFF